MPEYVYYWFVSYTYLIPKQQQGMGNGILKCVTDIDKPIFLVREMADKIKFDNGMPKETYVIITFYREANEFEFNHYFNIDLRNLADGK